MRFEAHNVGSAINPQVGLLPVALAGSADVPGPSFDRSAPGGQTYLSCTVFGSLGAAGGAPSAVAAAFRLQNSPDDSTWTDCTDPQTGDVQTFTVDAVNSSGRIDIDLGGAYEYVRVVATPTLTGGTSPSVEGQATIIFGGGIAQPA